MLHESWRAGVRKYVTLIGGCSYPAHAASPIREVELWNGYPQPESAPYSLAKRMDVVMADAYAGSTASMPWSWCRVISTARMTTSISRTLT